MSRDQLKRRKALKIENQRLHHAVSDLTLDKMILIEAERGNVWALRAAGNALTTCGRGLAYAYRIAPVAPEVSSSSA